MPRPRNIVEDHQVWIVEQYNNGISRQEIRDELRRRYDIEVSLATLSRRFVEWGLLKQRNEVPLTPEVLETIKSLIFRLGLNDTQIARRLHPERRWIRRINDDEERLKLMETTATAMLAISRESNVLALKGRVLLTPFIRQRLQLLIPRDPLWQLYKQLYPEEVDLRRRLTQRGKGRFLVPGPNYQWCIDGHDKLKHFGFEIYAAIDAYSRNIIWFYVGHTAATAISVTQQYLITCDVYRIRPWYLQSDLGSEVPLIAGAHWYMVRKSGGKVSFRDKTFSQGQRLKDCYKAATSTRNVKIEKWWESMLHASSRFWVDYFGELERDGDFDPEILEDQIALYAVYEDALRQELQEFVNTWNTHKIRLQKNRPHVIHGQPWYNYHFPDPKISANWGVPIDQSILQYLIHPIKSINIDNCLEPETKKWCREELSLIGFDEVKLGDYINLDKARPFKQFYIRLREKIRLHIQSGCQPILSYRLPPTGGVERYLELLDEARAAREEEEGNGVLAEAPLEEIGVEDEETDGEEDDNHIE